MDQFLTIVKPAIDAAAPYVKQAADAAFQIATPIASDVASQADNALRNAGVDTQTVVYAAKVFSTLLMLRIVITISQLIQEMYGLF